MAVKAQISERLRFSTTIGTGIPMSSPASTPFAWQVLGYYTINQRLSAGIGAGISLYEKTLIPLFADAKFNITKPKKFTPYIECGVGYSFAISQNANGGFYLSPSVGIEWSIYGRNKLLLAIGYESQSLERLKMHEDQYFDAEFKEQLNHNAISIKIGFIF